MNIVRYNDKRMRVNIDPFDVIEEAFVISGEFLSDKKESHKKLYIYICLSIQLNFNDRSKFLLTRFSRFDKPKILRYNFLDVGILIESNYSIYLILRVYVYIYFLN